MARWNTFHTPVHSACFLMDKAFCLMEHDSAAKLELIQVIKDFCTVETADGTKVGRDWKVVKSEYVSWQEVIPRKQQDLHDDHKLNPWWFGTVRLQSLNRTDTRTNRVQTT